MRGINVLLPAPHYLKFVEGVCEGSDGNISHTKGRVTNEGPTRVHCSTLPVGMLQPSVFCHSLYFTTTLLHCTQRPNQCYILQATAKTLLFFSILQFFLCRLMTLMTIVRPLNTCMYWPEFQFYFKNLLTHISGSIWSCNSSAFYLFDSSLRVGGRIKCLTISIWLFWKIDEWIRLTTIPILYRRVTVPHISGYRLVQEYSCLRSSNILT